MLTVAVTLVYTLIAVQTFRRSLFYLFKDELGRGIPLFQSSDWGIGLFLAFWGAVLWPGIVLALLIHRSQNHLISIPRSEKKKLVEAENKKVEKELGLVSESTVPVDRMIDDRHTRHMKQMQEDDRYNKRKALEAEEKFKNEKAAALLKGEDPRTVKYHEPHYRHNYY